MKKVDKITICLTRFLDDPWSKTIMEGMIKALKSNKKVFDVEEIFGYPNKNYDLIILVGTRSIIKRKLNPRKILPFCKKLIDMGDSAMDPRRNYESAYLYFAPSNKKLYDHYHYIPLFVREDILYPEKLIEDPLTLYVDHFKYQHIDERNQSIYAINKIFEEIKNSNIPLKIYYHTSKGIEENRFEPEIPEKIIPQCAKFIPYQEIIKYYRKTDIFFPTHRETLGMVAQEIGACGGITLMQSWMYPTVTHYQFPHIIYKEKQKIDFKKLKHIIDRQSTQKIREHVIKNCGFEAFRQSLFKVIFKLF